MHTSIQKFGCNFYLFQTTANYNNYPTAYFYFHVRDFSKQYLIKIKLNTLIAL